ncbi:MAG: DHA2 family efflux MFS transporter permease subunit [Bacteriovoracaceae bacterium]
MNKGSPLIIFVAVLASLLEIIDTSIVNVALPTMMGNLGATLEDISMVVTGYAIANAVVLPLSAWLGEKIGRRKYYLGCIALFTLTSVACGLAPNLEVLTIFRILQGLAGGALLPTSQTLIYEQFPREKAGMAGAIFGMSVMIGPALGPVLGGYLTDNFGWRSIFNINLPLGVFAFILGSAVIFDREKHASDEQHDNSFDTIGLILLCLGIGCLQFALERGEADDWFSSNAITACVATCTVCLPLFVWWELRVKNPVINVRLFKDGVVSNGVLLMGLLGFFLYALIFVLPVFIDTVFHYTATQTGMLFIPGSILTAMLMPVAGNLMMKGVSPKKLIGFGICMILLCQYLLTQLSPDSSQDNILHILYVRGLALAFLFVPINSSIISQFEGINMGQVSGLLNLFRQIGGSIGIALVGTLMSSRGHQNYIDLVSNVSLLNPNTQSAFFGSMSAFMSKSGVGFTDAYHAALTAMKGRVNGQVFIMNFIQLIWIIMIIFAFSFVPLFLIKFRKKPTKVADSH